MPHTNLRRLSHACVILTVTLSFLACRTLGAQQPDPAQNAPSSSPAQPDQSTPPDQSQQQPAPAQSDVQELQRTSPPPLRIPQQKNIRSAALQGIVMDPDGRPLPGIEVTLTPSNALTPAPPSPVPVSRLPSPRPQPATTAGDGIFRVLYIPPGTYDIIFASQGTQSFRRTGVRLNSGEVLSVEIHLADVENTLRGPVIPQMPAELQGETSYHELSRRPDANGLIVAKTFELTPDQLVYLPKTDRWNPDILPDSMDNYHRYSGGLEAPYVLGHWYDPFNRNKLKGDYPIFGQSTFFSFTGDSITAMDGRRLPVPSGQSTANPNSEPFFGKGGQFFVAQTFRLTFDLFHGDTTAFRPVDWRIRVTPAANVNYLLARENQAVSANDREGTTRLDGWGSLQEAFGEVKLHDFGPNYDFLNLRVGIQQFASDFRGFIFADEQPGVRLFGNLRSNRIQYNLAAFDLLEKNTNSGLNTFHRRSREVAIANIFIQDFLGQHGYTTSFSYHFARDNATIHYDDNGFLVRPAPIGLVRPHRIDAHYFGWTGDGHIGRLNIDHAFYQALGNDSLNNFDTTLRPGKNGAPGGPGGPSDINAQFAALELSRDEDWLRFRASFIFASGDNKPEDYNPNAPLTPNHNTERGFSSIVDAESFAGGEFSFFNREGIRFTGAGVALTSPDSFLPDLRSSKDEGQSNFVNPGLYLYNAGLDAKLTPDLKLVGNVSFLQFARTQPLVFLQQQAAIRRTIGTDSSIGFIYRPLLSDNVVITGGVAVLVPSNGLRDIYTSQTLLSGFATVRFQF